MTLLQHTAVALEGQGEVEQVVLENQRKIGLQVHILEHFGGDTGPWQTINTGTMQRKLGF